MKMQSEEDATVLGRIKSMSGIEERMSKGRIKEKENVAPGEEREIVNHEEENKPQSEGFANINKIENKLGRLRIKTLSERMKDFKVYLKLQSQQNYFTMIPRQYWLDNPFLGTTNYIKKKMNLAPTHKLTVQNKLNACIAFPEIFATQMLGIHPRPYQHYILEQYQKYRYNVAACSRRLGKTTCNRILLLQTGRLNMLPSDMGGTTWNVVLQDQDIANDLYIEPLHEIMERADKVTKENFKGALGNNFFTSALLTPRDKVGKVRVNKISFRVQDIEGTPVRTGITRITTFAPTKKVIGREGNLMGDEVSKWKENPKCKDEFKFYDQLIAILKDNPIYKGIFSSTPEGEEDVFALEMFDPNGKNKTNNYRKIWLPYWARQEENWIEEIRKTEEQAIRNRRNHTFLQEYEASFLTISEPFFNPEDISKVLTSNWRKAYSNNPCSLGLDWGGTQKSETAWVITEWDLKEESVRKVINKKSYPVGEDLRMLEPDLYTIKRNYNIKWVTPDNKGGRWMMPKLELIFGKGRVTPMNFTTDKKAGYEKVRQATVDKTIEIPNDVKMIKQLKGLTEELKPASTKGKDDEADALMMSMDPLFNGQPKVAKVWTY